MLPSRVAAGSSKDSTIRRYDRAPLIRPILFKAAFYWAVVFVARLLEHWISVILSSDASDGMITLLP
jgi:hypothetical protein